MGGTLPGKSAQNLFAPHHPNLRLVPEGKEPRPAAVLILLMQNQGQGQDVSFPLMLRPQYEGVHSGQVSLPGGSLEPADANLSETAFRETEEELGISAGDIELIGPLSELYIPPSNFMLHPFVGAIDGWPRLAPDPGEVQDVFYMSLAHLRVGADAKKTQEISVGKISLRAPYFEIEGEIIWGGDRDEIFPTEISWVILPRFLKLAFFLLTKGWACSM